MKLKRNLTLAAAVFPTVLLVGCVDGKDGAAGPQGPQGDQGPQGPGPSKSTVIEANLPVIKVLHYNQKESAVEVEFELTNKEDKLVNELNDVKLILAEVTEDKGVILSPKDNHGAKLDNTTVGAELIVVRDGTYKFTAPAKSINPSTNSIVWFQVGSDDAKIKKSRPVIVRRPETFTTTSTQACFSCHVDYSDSPAYHAEMVALDMDGKPDFIAGCVVCHNNKDGEHGGYAPKALSQFGHLTHNAEFVKDFSVTRCDVCHSDPIVSFDFSIGCSDCHNYESTSNANSISKLSLSQVLSQAEAGKDIREIHGVLWKKQIKLAKEFYTTTSIPYYKDNVPFVKLVEDEVTKEQKVELSFVDRGLCADITLFEREEGGDQKVNIAALKQAKKIAYADLNIRSYFEGRSVGPLGSRLLRVGLGDSVGSELSNADGSYGICYPVSKLDKSYGIGNLNMVVNSRLAFIESDSMLVSSSKVVDQQLRVVGEYDRKSVAKQCRTCHVVDSLGHFNDDGGTACIFCHDNGDEIPTLNVPPAFGPVVHKRHGSMNKKRAEGSRLAGLHGKPNISESTRVMFNPKNCVVCHEGGVKLSDVKDMYVRAKGFNNGDTSKMASPILSNCYGCHDDNAALNHMKDNGGEVSATVVDEWYKLMTNESCVTCHEVGSTFGIEKYHNFDRPHDAQTRE